MTRSPPAHEYYRANEGRWQGTLEFRIRDRAALRASALSWLDRMRVSAMARMGTATLTTRLDCSVLEERNEVLHWTWAHKAFAPLYRSEEVFTIDPDGCAFAIGGTQRLWPDVWRARSYGEGTGRVSDDGMRADYELLWLDVPLRQHVQRVEGVEGGVDVTMETDWSFAKVSLRRAPR